MWHRLPGNAYRKLEAWETYTPVLSQDKSYKEATFLQHGARIYFCHNIYICPDVPCFETWTQYFCRYAGSYRSRACVHAEKAEPLGVFS